MIGQLLINKIVCKDLVNVESLGGKNDPYIILRYVNIDSFYILYIMLY